MPVINTDMVLKLSVAAAAGNTTPSTPATSLGDQVSTTALTDNTLDNLFDVVTGSEAAAGDTEYRCVFVHNTHATDTASLVTITVQSETAGGASVVLALDNIGVTAVGSGSAQAATVANESTPPTGVGAYGAGPLSIGTMGPGTVAAVWVRRTVPVGATAGLDGAVLRIGGEG
jgi:hypothetical protein